MDKVFITDLTIEKVRHLQDIHIPLDKEQLKHLILTGKNGSGKTSVLTALSQFLNSLAETGSLPQDEKLLQRALKNLEDAKVCHSSEKELYDLEENVKFYRTRIEVEKYGIMLNISYPLYELHDLFQKGTFVLAYYRDNRIFTVEETGHVEKILLKDFYLINESPRKDFVKYLVDLKMTQALALTGGKKDKASQIAKWFDDFQNLLRRVFEDESLELKFDEDNFTFHIYEQKREPFEFKELSSGFAAILDIIADLIIRMEKLADRAFRFDMPGIVLIDEIETHLHLELQKSVLDMLTTIFPNIQFVVTTHSPFILNSLENVVIYDLERRMLVSDGLADVPYDGIVEGYFRADTMSNVLKEKFDRYRALVVQKELSADDLAEIARLELYLDEIPDYLALGITTEYQKLKLDFQHQEDCDGQDRT